MFVTPDQRRPLWLNIVWTHFIVLEWTILCSWRIYRILEHWMLGRHFSKITKTQLLIVSSKFVFLNLLGWNVKKFLRGFSHLCCLFYPVIHPYTPSTTDHLDISLLLLTMLEFWVLLMYLPFWRLLLRVGDLLQCVYNPWWWLRWYMVEQVLIHYFERYSLLWDTGDLFVLPVFCLSHHFLFKMFEGDHWRLKYVIAACCLFHLLWAGSECKVA